MIQFDFFNFLVSCFLLDVSEGDGDWAGKAKIVHLQMDEPDGRKFNGSFKGNMEEAAEFLANKHLYIGKKYSIYFNGFTGYGIPNYAIFCIKNSIERNDEESK